MTAKPEPQPLTRRPTESERRLIDSVETSLNERISILRDTRSADGIQESVLDRYRRINPPEPGQSRSPWRLGDAVRACWQMSKRPHGASANRFRGATK